MPTPPGPTSGLLKEFKVTCPTCYVERVIPARKVKLLKKPEKHLGGKLYHNELTFVCPKCGTVFTHEHDKWIPDPIELPVKQIILTSIARITNSPAPPKLKTPKEKNL